MFEDRQYRRFNSTVILYDASGSVLDDNSFNDEELETDLFDEDELLMDVLLDDLEHEAANNDLRNLDDKQQNTTYESDNTNRLEIHWSLKSSNGIQIKLPQLLFILQSRLCIVVPLELLCLFCVLGDRCCLSRT
ncbi:hypothetical protein M3Y96_00644900 [Aphelenchoides besseyi]|nr:hypothetical protein M3Y96_00644900 [Aphelenchoides besseyi]